LAAEVDIELRPAADEIVLVLRLHNRTGTDVTDVVFPWLSGWTGDRDGDTALVLGGARRFDPTSFPMNRGTTYGRWHQREFFKYPVDLYAPWADLSGRDGGVSIIDYRREGRNFGVSVENLRGYEAGLDVSLGWTHFLRLRSGESWESPPIGISVHGGTWTETADRYIDSTAGWLQACDTPQWARASMGFQNVMFKGFDGMPIRGFDSLPDIARQGQRWGIDHLSVWDYVLLGEYAKTDDVRPHEFSPEERAALQQALAAARRAGVHVSALENYRLVNPTSSLYAEFGEDEVCRRYDGTPFHEEYPGSHNHPDFYTNHLGPICHPRDARSASYRKRVIDLVTDSTVLGFDSLFYDQPFEIWPSYRTGTGDGPDGAHAAAVSLLGEARGVLRQHSPEGIVMGELCDVFATPWVDVWMSWYKDVGDLERATYSLPFTMQSAVVDADSGAASAAFAIGAQLCLTTHGCEGTLDDVPQFAAHVARLAALRRRCIGRMAGRFRGQQGLETASDGAGRAYRFSGAAGDAVTVAAIGDDAQITVDLQPTDRVSGKTQLGVLFRSSGEALPTTGNHLEVTLAENEVAVWYPKNGD
jgi:hypothetical protein